MIRRLGQEGMTLVEIMVVLVFVAIGVLALSAVQTRSVTDVHATGRHTRALDLAEAQMETARAAGYTTAASDSGVSGPYTWQTIIPADVAVPPTNMRTVTTTVTWNEGGAQRSVQLVSLLASR